MSRVAGTGMTKVPKYPTGAAGRYVDAAMTHGDSLVPKVRGAVLRVGPRGTRCCFIVGPKWLCFARGSQSVKIVRKIYIVWLLMFSH